MFMAIKAEHNGESFELWEDEIRVRKPEAMERYREKFKDEILFYKFIQFKFYEQWFKLKEYANDKGIKIIGDIPIYVAYDSADVWANPELFQMDEEVKPISVAGCPPDAFSADGQLWEILFTSGIIISRQVIHGGLGELKIAQSFMM